MGEAEESPAGRGRFRADVEGGCGCTQARCSYRGMGREEARATAVTQTQQAKEECKGRGRSLSVLLLLQQDEASCSASAREEGGEAGGALQSNHCERHPRRGAAESYCRRRSKTDSSHWWKRHRLFLGWEDAQDQRP
ncbi:hypothetical protein cyc_01474 [Cyclospora cayetanensis]|uniref:Uncharacterized protein n=1 Tax=Cyclospora cayetanensis TaxID=88456 RepID=A0A1D3D6T7_9EIME|nr:hypothetical protein cyc_01474 [Cyclospora cayetanensis]